MDSTIFTKINNLYNEKGFMDKYGLDTWITVIICLVFFVIITYFYILNNIEPIRADWENQKCNPSVIPFAGMINKGPNDTAFEYTNRNFTGCVQNILTSIVSSVFQPIYYIMANITSTFTNLIESVNSIRSMFDKIRNTITDFTQEVSGRTLNVTMPLVQMIIGIKSMGEKVTGVLTGSLYTLFGSYLTMKALLSFILSLVTTILIALAVSIAALLIISFIPIFGSWAIPVVAVNIAIMIAILIPTTIVQIMMSDILKLSSRSLPNVPRCFSGKTLVETFSKNDVYISDIEVGDILKGGEKVTAIMKFSAKDQVMYDIYGVHVTGQHRVFYKPLGWIKANKHPDRILITDFNEPFVYCIGTDTKTFHINGQLFSDWDDIDDHVFNCLERKCKNIKEIHKLLDNGMISSSLIKLNNKKLVEIKDIQVNDVLENGEIVLGIIKIDGEKIEEMYKYESESDNNVIYGFNVSKHGLGDLKEIKYVFEREKYLYQLLTNTGSFTVNGISVKDYNYGIDKYIL